MASDSQTGQKQLYGGNSDSLAKKKNDRDHSIVFDM